jgi:hypothetical protein
MLLVFDINGMNESKLISRPIQAPNHEFEGTEIRILLTSSVEARYIIRLTFVNSSPHCKLLHIFTFTFRNCDSSVGIALGYGLDDRGSRVRFPAGAGNFSLHRVQNSSGAHPASYPMGTRGSFPGGNAAGV